MQVLQEKIGSAFKSVVETLNVILSIIHRYRHPLNFKNTDTLSRGISKYFWCSVNPDILNVQVSTIVETCL